VTKYLDDHPGGAEVLLDVAGQDADEFFEDIGHSKEARKELSKYLIGNFKLDAAALEKMKAAAEKRSKSEGGMVSTLLVALIAIVGVAVAYYKTQQSAGAEEK
jgi:cytochrome b involved in lipid metabolism